MKKKKLSNAQLTKRIQQAVVFVERTKTTEEIYFFDKGLRLIVTEDYAVVETGWHRHVFNYITSGGLSQPCIFVRQFIEIANKAQSEHGDILDPEKGFSYSKLFEVLKKQEDQAEFNICWYVDLWLFNIFNPLYSIGTNEASSFLVYENYLHNMARSRVILEEKKEDVTNKDFIAKVTGLMQDFANDMQERVVFHKLTDEERLKQEVQALENDADDELLKQQMEKE